MLRVTIDMVPFGIEERKHSLRTLEIARTSHTNNPETYTGESFNHEGELTDKFVVREHWYDDGAEQLVTRALECLVRLETR